MRPARDSDNFGRSMTFADHVSRNCPGWRFRSMAALITGKISGTCCTSSSCTGIFSPATKPLGSCLAAARIPGSSKVRYWRFCPANSADCTSVLFPVWRAPLTRTAGMSANPSRSRSIRWRRSIAVLSTKKWMIINYEVGDYHVCPAFCQYPVQPRLLSLSFDFRTIVTHCRHRRPARRTPGKRVTDLTVFSTWAQTRRNLGTLLHSTQKVPNLCRSAEEVAERVRAKRCSKPLQSSGRGGKTDDLCLVWAEVAVKSG